MFVSAISLDAAVSRGAASRLASRRCRSNGSNRLEENARFPRIHRGASSAQPREGRRASRVDAAVFNDLDMDMCDVTIPGPSSPLFKMDISMPTVLTANLASVMDPPVCKLAPKKTHIICTLGPSSRTVDDLEKLLVAGMSVARFNFSHGTHEYHLESLQNLRQACLNTGKICAVLLDTKGPEIRSGMLEDGKPVQLKRGNEVILTTDYSVVGNAERIAVSYSHMARDLSCGTTSR